ncbi:MULTISPECIES: hypothetical protein [unclassified Sporosarcina]|uniref:hypothetical protein n=1 Tax=unclassified Sporosarcina TaxID=2647733 RepID=UPI000C16EB3A|nr:MULTISPECIES: hypothetical protein [unclassified Sporosarcina]PIC98871.1 hypothetical protein CSV68_10670 [Sporosarcina sp. P29]PID04512.1 hypothetical protein CSV66_14810 [Sporosarcina sp. P30]PID07858.1 hypothetical protein CSV65_13870 [Sporosarcina sp. P31]PID10831.1 hypothetical protein CSV64_14935 [Sporosarcina sp. P32b]
MKNSIRFSLGYLGYFLIGFMALRALIVQEDKIGFVILIVGLTLLIDYVASFEKKYGTPKYSGYIKSILVVAFIFSGFSMV